MLNNIKAAIFDMDGTLVDSMWIWEKIDIDFLKERNLDFPSDLRESIEHLSFEGVAEYFKKRFQLSENIDTIMDIWNNMAFNHYKYDVKLKPGAKEYLSFLKSSGIKLALATSNSDILLEVTLKKNDIFHYFDTIVTTSEVSRGKNFPDIYLLAADRLKVSPKDCIVFEDILPAIMGAKAAGMTVVGVQDDYSNKDKQLIMENADHYINEYTELSQAV